MRRRALAIGATRPGHRDNDLDPSSCDCGLLIGTNGRAVDHLDVAVMSKGGGVLFKSGCPSTWDDVVCGLRVWAGCSPMPKHVARSVESVSCFLGKLAEERACRKITLMSCWKN